MEDIYEPDEDSYLILNFLPLYAPGKRILDMGTGSGILALECLRFSNDVVAADINPSALQIAKKKFGTRALVIESDLFSRIQRQFDLILFNPPYLPNAPYGSKATDGGKRGSELIAKFLKQAGSHLDPGGIILLVFSSLTKKREVDRLITENGFKSKTLAEKHLFYETLYLYELKK